MILKPECRKETIGIPQSHSPGGSDLIGQCLALMSAARPDSLFLTPVSVSKLVPQAPSDLKAPEKPYLACYCDSGPLPCADTLYTKGIDL